MNKCRICGYGNIRKAKVYLDTNEKMVIIPVYCPECGRLLAPRCKTPMPCGSDRCCAACGYTDCKDRCKNKPEKCGLWVK